MQSDDDVGRISSDVLQLMCTSYRFSKVKYADVFIVLRRLLALCPHTAHAAEMFTANLAKDAQLIAQ